MLYGWEPKDNSDFQQPMAYNPTSVDTWPGNALSNYATTFGGGFVDPSRLDLRNTSHANAQSLLQTLPPSTSPAQSQSHPHSYTSGTKRGHETDDRNYVQNNPQLYSHSDSSEALQTLVPKCSIKKQRVNSGHVSQPPAKAKVGTPSKLSQKHQELEEKYGTAMVTKDNRIRGNVGHGKRGNLVYFDIGLGEWIPAAYHHDYRKELVAIATAYEPPYLVSPHQGEDEDDITSNCGYLSQDNFQFNTPGQLFEIQDEAGNCVMGLDERPARNIQKRGYLVYKGMVLLDQEDHPVLNWGKMIPLTFSSQMEGGRIEALRRIVPGLLVQDIRARSKLQSPSLSLRLLYILRTLSFREDVALIPIGCLHISVLLKEK